MPDPRPKTTPDADRRLDRRGFLGAAGGAGAAALALTACGGGSSHEAGSSKRRSAAARHAPTGPRYRSRPDLRPPGIAVTRRPPNPRNQRFVFTECHGGRGQQGPMIIDRGGRLVWFLPVSDHGSTRQRVMNVRVQRYHQLPVLTWWQGGLVGAHGAGHYEIWDQRYRRVAQVHAADGHRADLHEFRITDRDTALLTSYVLAHGDIPTPSGRSTRRGAYWACVAQEIDIASGRLLLGWRSDEHVPFSASHRLPPPEDPNEPWDYFHINSIAVDPADENLVISSRNTWSAYKVHRRSGETLWTLGGDESDFTIGANATFAFQHHVIPRGNGRYTVFDNEAGPPNHASQSRGLVLDVDERRRTARFVREYRHRPAVLSDALGSVELLEGGGAFVGWGESSYFTEYDGRGQVVLDARLDGGVVSYRAFLNGWRGEPAHPPQLAVQRHGAGARVYASWNGSTIHHRWRVVGGPRKDALTDQVALADVTGFETVVHVRRAPAWVAVEALDGQGLVAARSAAVKTP